jgi:hypothetical protein
MKPDWIVIAKNGDFLVVDNESLKKDGILAHALNSVHKSCESAQAAVHQLDEEK